MRTTIMLPPELLRAAKARAAERGETLKSLLTRAVTHELGQSGEKGHVEWPLIRSRHKAKRRLTNEDLEDILIADDVERLRRGSR